MKKYLVKLLIKKLPELITSRRFLATVVAWASVRWGVPEGILDPLQHLLAELVPWIAWLISQGLVDQATAATRSGSEEAQ